MIDKRCRHESDFAMGKCYYSTLRQLYGDEAPERLIVVADKSEFEIKQVQAWLRYVFCTTTVT